MGIPTRYAVHQIQYHWTHYHPQIQASRSTGGANCSLDAAGAGREPGAVPKERLPISRVTACVSGDRPTACSPFGEMGRSMTLRWAFFLLFFASTAFSQTPPPGSSSNVNPGRPVEPGRALYLR